MDSGEFAPAVLLHGFGDSPECWSPLLAAIDHDVRVSTPAAPGHAGEALPAGAALELDYLAETALVHVAASAQRAGRPVVVGGHSMGAATAVALTVRRPDLVAALYLEDPPWSWPPRDGPDETAVEQTAEFAQWIAGLQGSSHEDRVQWCLDHNPGWPHDEYDIWARAKGEVDPAVFAQPIDVGRFSWQSRADQVRCPVSLVVGDWRNGSACMPEVVDYLAARPNWHVIRIPGAGHDVRRQNRGAAIDAFVGLLRAAA